MTALFAPTLGSRYQIPFLLPWWYSLALLLRLVFVQLILEIAKLGHHLQLHSATQVFHYSFQHQVPVRR